MTENKLMKYLIFAVIIFSPIFYYGAYTAGVFAFFVLMKNDITTIRQIMTKQKPLVLMLAAFLLSTLFSKVPGYSLLIDGVILLHVMIYIVILSWVSKENIEGLFRLLNTMGICICLFGIYQYFTGDLNIDRSWTDQNAFGDLVRIYSTLRNPNIFAAYLTVNICYSMAYFLKKKADIYIAVNIMLSSLCLLLTYSRGGFFALVAAMLFITIVCKERKAFYYIGIMLLLYYSFHFLQSTYRSDMSKLMIDSSSIYRLEIWRSSWELFKSNTLLGAGPGSVEKLLSYSSNSLKGIIMHAHNIPLQLLAETGILGLTAIVIFIFSELKRSLPICQKYRDIEHSYIAVGFGAALTGILAHGLVDCAVFIPSRSLVFLVYFGLFPAIYRKNHDKLR